MFEKLARETTVLSNLVVIINSRRSVLDVQTPTTPHMPPPPVELGENAPLANNNAANSPQSPSGIRLPDTQMPKV